MHGNNYLPILLIVIVILYFWCNKSSFGNEDCNPALSVDNSWSYQLNNDGTSCVLYKCASGYTPGEGDLIGTCAEIGVTECVAKVENGKKFYDNINNDGINTAPFCKTICDNGYRTTKNSSGYDTCTWTKLGACVGSDPNGVYTYNSSEICNLQSCKFGYMPSANKCIPVPPGYYSSSNQI